MKVSFLPALAMALAAAVGLPGAVWSADLTSVGTVSVTSDDTEYELWIPYDEERGGSSVTAVKAGILTAVSVRAWAGAPGGALERPSLEMSINHTRRATGADLLVLHLAGNKAYAATEDFGSFTVDAFDMDEGSLSFDFSATAVASEAEGGIWSATDESDRIELSGHLEAEMPDVVDALSQ